MIKREQAEAIIREQVTASILQDLPTQSVIMGMATKLPNMTSNQTRMRVLDFLPTAYWVTGDTGFKKISRQAWDNVWLTAEELAVIVPISEAVLDDAEFDIFGEVTPRVIEAMGQKIDSAIVFGTSKPASWPNDIITQARQAGNNVSLGSGDLFDLILGENGVISKVETDGYNITGSLAGLQMKSKLRGVRDTVGQPLFKSDMQGATNYSLDGTSLYFPTNGMFDNTVAQLIVGDFKQAVYSIRQDVTVKILDQAVIQDPATKEIIYNLAQQDMVALRVVMRLGWALPTFATRLNEDRTGCCFAYLEPSTPTTTQTVTFTVSDDSGSVKGARVDVNGSRLVTSDSGEVVFNLRPGTYPYKVTMKDMRPVTGNVTVIDAAIDQSITLVAQ